MIVRWSACVRALLCFLWLSAPWGVAHSADLKLLCAVALQSAMTELMPQFERSSGNKVMVQYGTAGAITDRLERGETGDVAISARQQIANLVKKGKIVEGLTADVARFGVGIFVRKGSPKPDIGSVEAFKRALLEARSLAHADPARGGVTAIYVAKLLDQFDNAGDLKRKTTVFAPGVYDSVVNGEVEIGFGGISEIMADARVELVGPLPLPIQNYTTFAAGVVSNSKQQDAAKALIHFISSPDAAAVMRAKGFEPL